MPGTDASPYDALILLSFGGPNRPDDVMPFLRNVVRGKNIPDERLADVAEHYLHFGGKSPINDQNLALLTAIRAELASRGVNLPVVWGNRNWHPYTVDVLRDLEAFGVRRALVLTTSAYGSYSGVRQYQEHLAQAIAESGAGIQIDMLAPFFNTPGFVEANVDAIAEAVASLSAPQSGDAPVHIAYVTHSIPETMERASGVASPSYLAQHEDVAALVTAGLAERSIEATTSLSFCSRSGSPHVPWLEPDVNLELGRLAGEGRKRVVIAPIGFLSDHMEVLFDLDTEAMETARELGIEAARSATAGLHPAFVGQLVDLVMLRAARERGEDAPAPAIGAYEALPDVAPEGAYRMRFQEDSGLAIVGGHA